MFHNRYFELTLDNSKGLLYRPTGSKESVPFSWPQFEINGEPSGTPEKFEEINRVALNDAIIEITGVGKLACGAELTMVLRVSEHTPLIRFRYLLSAPGKQLKLAKKTKESLTYLSYPTKEVNQRTEVIFSNYNHLIHAYQLMELPAFAMEDQLMGPILTEQRGEYCLLTAYEHGSHYQDKFVVFEKASGKNAECIELKALRGNYWNGQVIGENVYETIWLQIGMVKGDINVMARAYREFQLKYCTPNAESRKPYIFYNTWAFQERNKAYNNMAYLSSMNQTRMEEEIDIAHEMGIEVFVIDTGWYQKTGDWEVDQKKFPDGLQSVRDKLKQYGMKLGLWFDPAKAAKTSGLLLNYPKAIATEKGQKPVPHEVWETEESYEMCLVSEFWTAFADHLIHLVDTLGVTYFKWDGISQYGCDRRDHYHGGDKCTEEEARDCYAFQLGLYMTKIIDRVHSVHPEVIVDFDVTEDGRSVGLGFLSYGKYFAINNGPYFENYGIQVPEGVWVNIFVHPGAARCWICRQILDYDRWIPSTLMMTHYLPDDPEESQMNNIASLILGQNGIWGDLPGVSKNGRALIAEVLGVYKRVRVDITESYPVTLGQPGFTVEVHEKISSAGRGVIVIFDLAYNVSGHVYEYKIQNSVKTDCVTIFGDAELIEEKDQVKIRVKFSAADAVMVFFE